MTSRLLRKAAFAFTVVLGGAALASADPPKVAATAQPGSTDPNAAPHAYRAKEILGSKINIQNNTSVGTVDDIVFTDAGDVEYLVVARSDGKLVSVPWSAATFNVAQKTAVVNITPEQYKVIPTYTATTYPQFFTPTYRTETYKYYGLTPGQLRRAERRIERRNP